MNSAKVTVYGIINNIQKSVAFLYTNNELSEREIKKAILSVPVPYCFDCCTFVVQFEIREYDTSSFVFSQDRLFCVSKQILELFA